MYAVRGSKLMNYSILYPDLLHVLCITEHHLNYAQLFGMGIDNYKL